MINVYDYYSRHFVCEIKMSTVLFIIVIAASLYYKKVVMIIGT